MRRLRRLAAKALRVVMALQYAVLMGAVEVGAAWRAAA